MTVKGCGLGRPDKVLAFERASSSFRACQNVNMCLGWVQCQLQSRRPLHLRRCWAGNAACETATRSCSSLGSPSNACWTSWQLYRCTLSSFWKGRSSNHARMRCFASCKLPLFLQLSRTCFLQRAPVLPLPWALNEHKDCAAHVSPPTAGPLLAMRLLTG